MRRAGSAKPHNRDGIWYLVRRVPKEFQTLDRRGLVRLSTNIAVADDPRAVRATPMVRQLSAELEIYWRGMLDGQSAEARLRYEAAAMRARQLGLAYQTNKELADGQTAEILRRVQVLIDRNALDDEAIVPAVMGGEQKPGLKLSGLVAAYEGIMSADLLEMSPKQLHKWRLPKTRAMANLKRVLGEDKEVAKLTREDAVKFRFWWQDRIRTEELDIGTANKDIGHISKMMQAVSDLHQWKVDPVFHRLRIPGEKDKQRAAFTPEWVQEKILATGAMDELNEEARAIVFIVAYFGARPSEVANLREKTIRLTAKVPHFSIEPNGRKVKTDDSVREIPLFGFPLEVMKRFPDGFPRYRDNEDSLSALVNKFFDAREWLPTDGHSVYSLRHCFEDRLTAAEAPEKVIATLMGHKWHRPKYGAGPTLEQKLRWLKKIAFKPPMHF